MKKAQTLYTSWESTPLKWHKSMLAVSLFRAIYSFGSLVYLFTDLSGDVYSFIHSAGGGWVYLLDISSSVVFGLTALISFVGLRRHEWTGVTVMLLWNALQAAFGVVGLALVGQYDQLLTTMFGSSFSLNSSVGEFIMDNVTSLVTGVILFFANRIYYKKRRLLFSPYPFHVDTQTAVTRMDSSRVDSTSSVDLLAQLRDECEAEQAAKQQPKLPDSESPDRSPTALKLLCGGLACACVVLLICCVHQVGTADRLESELAQVSKDITYYKDRTAYLERRVKALNGFVELSEAGEAEHNFWRLYVVLTTSHDGIWFHEYGCSSLDGAEASSDCSIRFFENAILDGYLPCPKCYPDFY